MRNAFHGLEISLSGKNSTAFIDYVKDVIEARVGKEWIEVKTEMIRGEPFDYRNRRNIGCSL
ncbi:hypothetical protein JXA02_02840 [candidate division KSB1 bacterium]|nr:hypothetical protein [candidate division KSB1 bacterium]RQW09986.1 MAG: hypothetical protein EH222_03110 [candidate division KSB1 bacterium]